MSDEKICDMDPKFHPAQRAMAAGDLALLTKIINDDPSLLTAESSCSHPRLIYGLVLQMPPAPNLEAMIDLLTAGETDVTHALGAAASMNNVAAIKKLLDLGANPDGDSEWSPLEEALYWTNTGAVDLLLSRGAKVDNLRKAASVGRLDLVRTYFDESGQLKPEAGEVNGPFGPDASAEVLRSPEAVLVNVLVHAASWNRAEVVRFLLDRGAAINAIPLGFDFNGTALHYAALNGHRELADQLLAWGADPACLDGKVKQPPEGWAAHGNHQPLADHLKAVRESRASTPQ